MTNFANVLVPNYMRTSTMHPMERCNLIEYNLNIIEGRKNGDKSKGVIRKKEREMRRMIKLAQQRAIYGLQQRGVKV